MPKPSCQSDCINRRTFVATSGAACTMLLSEVFPGRVFGQQDDTEVQVSKHPRTRIAAMSELKPNEAVSFNYPTDHEFHNCMLVKTGETSGGGVGPDRDIVAFNARCTHMGGSLEGDYKPEHKVAGPCSLHLTTFDLTRHGMVVAGHATQTLPQIILELDGDDIFAVGIVGLVYGFSSND